ncbi:Lactonase, 7-bladed beta-propeller-domain-containing protein [Naematelia encephala]|uniref:Lactonase, 7-bladed beta-propeller-domain-containing protein n=1 Tax=Naematelia encephala TaxID=71784 RepID=A0A1Y2AQY9_9TREE|nr:Lactonase, 7-bladed beta-propeller-domain-containing protein [Naematelia encephala]
MIFSPTRLSKSISIETLSLSRKMSTYRLLAGGYRSTISLLSFDSSNAKLHVISDSPAPSNASWLELSPSKSGVLYSLSEDDKGLALSLKFDGKDRVEITGERETNGVPAHVCVLKDGSGIIAGNYGGGSIIYFPIDSDGKLSKTSESFPLKFPFVYEGKEAPVPDRQDTPHPHQIVEGEKGTLYVPDLGNDRIWVIERQGEQGFSIKGYLQCPEGDGPRHAVISPDGKHLYVLTELSNNIIVFSLNDSTYPAHPLPDFETSILPPGAPKPFVGVMSAAELLQHPSIPGVLYASNRGEVEAKKGKKDAVEGDTIAICLLSADGLKIEEIKQVRTDCDFIRAMQISPDGQYVALAGQNGGGVEIWKITGERGDVWKLAAKEESITKITDFVWV